MLTRRQLGMALLGTALTSPSLAAVKTARVWKSATCGCCKVWIKHLEANGFSVESFNVGNQEARKELGMPAKYGSCHTADIGGYAIEGHVPAADILRLLDEQPDAVGLAVPAMPRGSPGMDGPQYGDIVDPYDVLLIAADGSATVYASYR